MTDAPGPQRQRRRPNGQGLRVLTARVDPAVYDRALEKAHADGKTLSHVVAELLTKYAK